MRAQRLRRTLRLIALVGCNTWRQDNLQPSFDRMAGSPRILQPKIYDQAQSQLYYDGAPYTTPYLRLETLDIQFCKIDAQTCRDEMSKPPTPTYSPDTDPGNANREHQPTLMPRLQLAIPASSPDAAMKNGSIDRMMDCHRALQQLAGSKGWHHRNILSGWPTSTSSRKCDQADVRTGI